MSDSALILLGCAWLVVWGLLFGYSKVTGQVRFDNVSMRLVLATVAWIGIAPILFGIAGDAKTLIAVFDFVVFTGLVAALLLMREKE
jgi:ABC-type nitrate/sulfonate/bicarbonate transport system permease component